MPSSTVRTFTDPDAYHAAIRHTHAEGIVTGRGQFHAELTLVRLNRVSLHRSDETLPRLTYSAVDPALFLVAFPVHRDQQLYLGGLEMAHGDIFAFRAGSEAYNRLAAGCRWGSIFLTHEDIAAAGEAIVARELTAPPVTHRIKPPPGGFEPAVEPP